MDSALDACLNGMGLGLFLSYQVAPSRKANALTYVLEKFELDTLPVQVVYPHSKLASTKVHAFVEFCVERLRGAGMA